MAREMAADPVAGDRPSPPLEPLMLGDEPDELPGPSPKPVKTRATAFLDGLRGLAALLVYFSHHYVWMYGTEDPAHLGFGQNGVYAFAAMPFIRVFFTGGSPGVAIFFVLSGYVLSRAPLAMLRGGPDSVPALRTRLFYSAIRRPFRLFIPVAGVSLLFAMSLHLPFGMEPMLTWPTAKETVLGELGNFLFEFLRIINPFLEHGIHAMWFPYNPPAWTISIEFAGSILVFGLVALLPLIPARARGIFLIALGTLLLFLGAWAMALFVAGIVLAVSDIEGAGDVPHISRVLPKSGLSRSVFYNSCFVFGWYLMGQVSDNWEAAMSTPGWATLTLIIPPAYLQNEYWRYYNSVGAILMVLAAVRLRWLQEFLTTRPLRWLGRVSFSLYLTQFPLLWTVGDRVYRLFGTRTPVSVGDSMFDNRLYVGDIGPHGLSTRWIAVQLVMLSLNLLVAEWGTVLLDDPSVKISRWVEGRIRGNSTAQTKPTDRRQEFAAV